MNQEVLSILRSGLCEITFTKKDGTERTIVGTLNDELIPDDKKPKGEDRVHSTEVQPVYEVELDQWRSFRWDTLISYRKD
jgi:hypothetical protein